MVSPSPAGPTNAPSSELSQQKLQASHNHYQSSTSDPRSVSSRTHNPRTFAGSTIVDPPTMMKQNQHHQHQQQKQQPQPYPSHQHQNQHHQQSLNINPSPHHQRINNDHSLYMRQQQHSVANPQDQGKRGTPPSNINSTSKHGPVHSSFESSQHDFHRTHSRQSSQSQGQSQNYSQGQSKNGNLDPLHHLSRHGYAMVTQPESSFDYSSSHVRAQAHRSRSNSQSRSQNNYNNSNNNNNNNNISPSSHHGQQQQQLQSPRMSHAHTNSNSSNGNSKPSAPPSPILLSPSLSSSSTSLNRYASHYSPGSQSSFSAPPPPPPSQGKSNGVAAGGGGGPIRSSISNIQHGPHPYQQQQQQQQQQHRPQDIRPYDSHSRYQSQHPHTSHINHSQKPPHQAQYERPNYSSSHMGPNLPHQHPDHQAVQPQPQPQQQPGQKSYSQSYHQSQRQPSENHLNLHGSSRPDHRSPHYSRRSESRAIDDDDDEEDDGEVKGNHLMQDGPLNKKEGQQDNSSEMHKCLDCGKIYKHPNCLWKHRWLHSVYWKGATKFLLSKHQQVQLMEAAAILLGMDESRQGDKDPIVSMFSKQRGALANSIGSSLSTSSSSGSPPTSTKSLSASPPPMSHQTKANDIQMLNALRNESVSIKVENLTPLKTTTTTATVTTSLMSSATTSPTNAKSATSLNPSSSSSTPPNLAPDDDSLPDPDDDLVVISPPSHRGSMISSAPVHMTVNGPPSVVVEMDLGMDVDQKPLHSKRGLEHKQQQLHMQHDGYRY